ncbi:MAG: hypothetical protein KatS3mg030_167 [Saprospiraceae bacterium]|nr:MAG: hypothetical protein KatS3mg030_167 [Saprospiraceae bacterium]
MKPNGPLVVAPEFGFQVIRAYNFQFFKLQLTWQI